MKNLLMKIASILLCASMLLCMNVSAVTLADKESVQELGAVIPCENNVLSTVNEVSACTDLDGNLHICNNNFPDTAFREYLLKLDDNNDGYFSSQEYLSIVTITVTVKYSELPKKGEIRSLKGIEFFPNLNKLDCSNNQIEAINLSNNKALLHLNCCDNQLTELDIRSNQSLTFLDCAINQLAELDVSNNTDLTVLECGVNQLNKLDISKNKSLKDLSCFCNQLTELDVSNNHALISLDCWQNQLTDLDVSNNLLLELLICSVNPLSELDLSNNSSLQYLSCLYNQLTELDVSRNIGLLTLSCGGNQLTELDLSNNVELSYLTCSYNQLSTLDLSSNTALTELNCSNNQLTALDLSNNTKLSRWTINDQKRVALELFDYNDKPAVYLGDVIPSEHFNRIANISASTFDPETGIAVINSENLSDIYYVYDIGKESSSSNLTVGIDFIEHTDHIIIKAEAKVATHEADGNTEYYICTVCHKIFSDENATNEIALADTIIAKTEHEYITSSDNNNHWKECSCGSISEAAPHTFEWKIDRQPSEDETGLKHEECSVCGFVRSENTVIDTKHIHTGIIHHDAVIATCSTKGNIEYWTCSSPKCDGKYYSDADCNVEISVIETDIDLDNHGESEILGTVEPSCTKTGYTGDAYCKDCNAKISDGEAIPKSVHSLIKTEAKDAAENSNGNIKYYTCSVCNKIFKDSEATKELSLTDTVIPGSNAAASEIDGNIWLYDHIDNDDVKNNSNAIISKTEFIYSDSDDQDLFNIDDTVWLFDHINDTAVTNNISRYDFNGDGAVTKDDASYLLLCVLMPDKYELKE